MDEFIKVYMSGKNYKAEGLYNLENGELRVLSGSVVVKEEPPSFRKYYGNVANIRSELIDRGIIRNYEFLEDYTFDIPFHASGVVQANGQTGAKAWKTRDGITIEEIKNKSRNLEIFKLFLSKFKSERNKIDTDKIIEEFQQRFPLEELKNLTIEEYDKTGDRTSLAYAIEHGTNEIFKGFLGNNRNKIIFNSPDGGYDTIEALKDRYPDLSVEEIFERYKEGLYTFIKEFNPKTYSRGYIGALPPSTNTIRSKLVMLYRPYQLLHLSSITVFKKILDYFGIEYNTNSDSIEMNIKLKEFLEENLETNMDIVELSNGVWQFYLSYVDKKQIEAEEELISFEDLFIVDEYIHEIARVLRRKKNIILRGVPGVGKTYCIKTIIRKYFDTLAEDSIEMIQFHQSYSYEEFIEGLRPQMNGGFDIEKGLFYDISIRAKDNPDNDYFLVIDEINRGNLSKIFGELLLLIENDKRENYSIKLPYSKEEFTVPSNLYIIGTMNTADRSLTIVDYALRRRFSFLTLEPAFNTYKFNSFLEDRMGLKIEDISKINQAMEKTNQLIKRTLGEEFLIGHSYFIENQDKIDDFHTWYRSIVEYDIIPMIEEYYYDDKDRIIEFKDILGV